jgi:putative tricarboxylic transport membrane protein
MIFTAENLVACLIGVLVGTLTGVLPGLGPIAAMSLLLPLTFGVGPTAALIMFAGIYYGAMYGGSTTSVLMNIPGEGASVYHLYRRVPDGEKKDGRAPPWP